jgi:histidyl-tRNA synthetase
MRFSQCHQNEKQMTYNRSNNPFAILAGAEKVQQEKFTLKLIKLGEQDQVYFEELAEVLSWLSNCKLSA